MLSLNRIAADLESFLFVLLLFMLMFGNLFYVLLLPTSSTDEEDELSDYDDDDPWSSSSLDGAESIFTMYVPSSPARASHLAKLMSHPCPSIRMMLGDFERGWFSAEDVEPSQARLVTTRVALLAFVVFQFLITIVMLNMLVAVVSDSYECAQTRAANLYLRTRIKLTAELVVIGAAKARSPTWVTNVLGFVLQPLKAIFRTSPDALDEKDENSSEDDWRGRLLEQEVRTRKIVQKNGEILKGELERIEQNTDAAFRRLDERIGNIEKSNRDTEARIIRAIEQLQK